MSVLCVDCMIYVANGEEPTEDTAEWRERVEAHKDDAPGYWVITCDGEEFATDDPDLLHRHFSNTACGMCGTSMGGDRCPAEWIAA